MSRKGIGGLIGLGVGLILAKKLLKPTRKFIKPPKIKRFKY